MKNNRSSRHKTLQILLGTTAALALCEAGYRVLYGAFPSREMLLWHGMIWVGAVGVLLLRWRHDRRD